MSGSSVSQCHSVQSVTLTPHVPTTAREVGRYPASVPGGRFNTAQGRSHHRRKGEVHSALSGGDGKGDGRRWAMGNGHKQSGNPRRLIGFKRTGWVNFLNWLPGAGPAPPKTERASDVFLMDRPLYGVSGPPGGLGRRRDGAERDSQLRCPPPRPPWTVGPWLRLPVISRRNPPLFVLHRAFSGRLKTK